MARINAGGGSDDDPDDGGGGDISLSREDLGLEPDSSGGSSGGSSSSGSTSGSSGGGGGSTDTTQDPFAGAQTGSDVFQPGSGTSSGTTDSSDTSGGGGGGTSGGGTSGGSTGGGGGGGLTDAQRQNVNAALIEDSSDFRQRTQGVESRGGRVGEQAQQLEQQVLGQYEGLRPQDVRVERDGDTIRTELTASGREFFGQTPTQREVADFQREYAMQVGGALQAARADPGRPEPEPDPFNVKLLNAAQATPRGGADRNAPQQSNPGFGVVSGDAAARNAPQSKAEVRRDIINQVPGARNIQVTETEEGYEATYEAPGERGDAVTRGARGFVEDTTGVDLPTEPEIVAGINRGIDDVFGVSAPTQREISSGGRTVTREFTGIGLPTEPELSSGLRENIGDSTGVVIPGEDRLTSDIRGGVSDTTGVGLPGGDTSAAAVLGAGAPAALAEPSPFGEAALAGAVLGAGIAASGDTITRRASDTPVESEVIPGMSATAFNPERTEIDAPEGGGSSVVTTTELGVPDTQGISPTEFDAPTGGLFTNEFEAVPGADAVSTTQVGITEPTTTTEFGVPGAGVGTGGGSGGATTGDTSDSVVPGDYPLAGRDFAADPGREYVSGGSQQPALSAQQLFGGQRPIERERERQRERGERLRRDDIPANPFGEITQPGPSVREQLERDDLFAPVRGFPTGESAVVGRGVFDPLEESRELLDQSQTPSVGEGAGDSLLPDVWAGVGPDAATRAGVGARGDVGQTPRTTPVTIPGLGTDLQQRQGQQTGQFQAQGTGLNLFTGNPYDFGNPNRQTTGEGYGYGFGYGFGSGGRDFDLPEPERSGPQQNGRGSNPFGIRFENPIVEAFGGGGNTGGLFGGFSDGGLFGLSGTDDERDDYGPFGGWW